MFNLTRLIAGAVLFLGLAGAASAQTTISGLPSATTPLAGTEVGPIVQAGVTRKAPVSAYVILPTQPASFISLAINGLTATTGNVNITGQYQVSGTQIGPANLSGLGTGVATALGQVLNASGGLIALTPTRAGDIGVWSGSAWVSLAGNNSGTKCLQETSVGVASWQTCGTGGGTPGGSTSDVQYNTSGSFAGNGGLTYDGTSVLSLGVSGTSVGAVSLNNATSGSVTIHPPTGALGSAVAIIPANTGTIAEINLAQSFSALQTFTVGAAIGNTTSNALFFLNSSASSDASIAETVANALLITMGAANTFELETSSTNVLDYGITTASKFTVAAAINFTGIIDVSGNAMTFPGSSATLAGLGVAQTWTAIQKFTNSDICLLGSSSGCTTFTSANAGASNFTLTFPATNDTLVALAATQTLTNKTLTSPVLGGTPTGAGASITINSTTCSLASSCAISAPALVSGSTSISGGANPGILSNNAGVLNVTTAIPSGITAPNLTTIGTIGTGTWQGTLIALAYGGTNNNLTASAGGIVWSDASKLNILAGTVTASQCLLSGSNAAPTWGSCSGAAAVSSVSNSDSTITATPTTGAVVVSLNLGNANTWTAVQTFTNSDIRLLGSSTGYTAFTSANAGASNFTITFPARTDTVALLGTAQTFSAAQTFSGTVAITAVQTVNLNAAGSSVPAAPTGTAFRAIQSDGSGTFMVADSFGSFGQFMVRRADTSGAAPSAVQSGEWLGHFGARGYGTSQYAAAETGWINFLATQNFTNTAMGTEAQIGVTPPNSVNIQYEATFNALTSGSPIIGLGNETNPQFGFVFSKNVATGLSFSGSTETAVFAEVDGTSASFAIASYGVGTNGVIGFSSGGTAASPSATSGATRLNALGGAGYANGSFTGSSALIALSTISAWSNTDTSSLITFATTPVGSTTRATALTIQGSGGLSVGAAAADPGINSINLLTGGTYQINGSQISSAALSDTTPCATWTPTDQSGASLTFTSVNGRYCKFGNMVYVYASLTYPSTASGATALISLPVAVPNQSYANSLAVANGGTSTIIKTVINSSTARWANTTTTSGTVTNANLTGLTLSFLLVYPAS